MPTAVVLTVVFGSGTQFRNGSIEDLTDGVRVEVDGSLDGTTLNAREVSFKRERIIVQGPVTNVLAGRRPRSWYSARTWR